MKFVNLPLLVPLFLLDILSPASAELKPLQGKVISGLYYEESTKFLPYTKVAPVVFQFKLKSTIWMTNAAFQILPRLTCRSDSAYPVLSTADWYFSCPVMFHLNQLLQQFRLNYTDTHPFSPTTSNLSPSLGPQENQKFSIPQIRFDDCDSVLGRMWRGITNRDMGFPDYKGILEKCSSLPVYLEESIQDVSPDFTTQFDYMQSNFLSQFFLNSSDPGEIINNLLALQGIQLQTTLAELARLQEAALSCQKNLIPHSFVKTSRFETALVDMRQKLFNMRYALSTQSIRKLYNLPIADCIFGVNTLIVQILLPVTRASSSYTLLQVNSPIFLYSNRLCRVSPGVSMSPNEYLISDDEPPSKYYLFEKTSKIISSTQCMPGESSLCHIPDQASRPLLNRCLYSILNGTSFAHKDDVRHYCELQCEKEPLSDNFAKLLIPVIQRISSNKFVVAVNRITTLLIKCEGKEDEMVTPQAYGAVEISLGCGCYLMWHSEKYEARVPCTNAVVIRHVVPEQMLNRSDGSMARNKVFLDSDLGERINSSLIRARDDDALISTSNGKTAGDFAEDSVENESRNLTEMNSLSVLNNTMEFAAGYSYFGTCYGGVAHTFLWIIVGVETTLFLGIALYLYSKMSEMSKKMWNLGDRTTVSYSSEAHLTNMYE